MVLDPTLLNNQPCKVQDQGKGKKRSSLHLGVVAIEKGAFRSLLTKVSNFAYYYDLCNR